jgi:hypothetical protein
LHIIKQDSIETGVDILKIKNDIATQDRHYLKDAFNCAASIIVSIQSFIQSVTKVQDQGYTLTCGKMTGGKMASRLPNNSINYTNLSGQIT